MTDKPSGILSTIEYRMGKQRTVTDKPLGGKKPNAPLELSAKLKKADSAEEKRILVEAHMGELFYAFGDTRKPWKPWLTYEENIDTLYLGGVLVKKEKS